MDLAELRAKIRVGFDQLDRGEKVLGEQVFAELRQRNRYYQLDRDQQRGNRDLRGLFKQ